MGTPRTERFGRFELLEQMGMGSLFMRHQALATEAPAGSRPVVLTRLSPGLTEDPAVVEEFLDLASLSARLQHENVVRVLDFGMADGEPFLVREWAEGQDLGWVQVMLRRRGMWTLPEPIVVSIGMDICQGLQPAHPHVGLVHGELSPSNVLMGNGGEVKLLEFGFNRWTLRKAWAKWSVGVMGIKLKYFAPEQLLDAPVDGRADVYVLGVLLYTLLCGDLHVRSDFDGNTVRDVMEGRLIPARQRNPSLDAELVRILERALARSVDDRYPSAEAMGQALAAWLKAHAPTFSRETRKQWLASVLPPATPQRSS
ncbi:serine/threonine protein kinase [Corallococcus interemptor]|uniref:Serine/threonine protein kinase n=1 Tax=Corallococcus interemptor TaxID=2316720 RepID=A0A3A8QNU6_9BACT|nr:serine/threonine-protein kinase [Corallococcus interemptor]RKH64864.1 serine/threonine protein kinase [Corallococcus interemptor]